MVIQDPATYFKEVIILKKWIAHSSHVKAHNIDV